MVFSIHVPDGIKLLIKSGQNVNFDTPLYETATQEDFDIQVARKLGVPPNTIFRYLKKFVGEDIKKGEILAVKKTFFTTKKIQSDSDGMIKEINHTFGSLRITASSTVKNRIKAYFKGEITEIKNGAIHVKIKEGQSYPLKKASESFGGETVYVAKTNENMLSEETCETKVAVAESLSSYTLSKLEALGTKGIISLQNLEITTTLPIAQIKMIDDMNEILKQKFSCCTVDHKSSTITFYN